MALDFLQFKGNLGMLKLDQWSLALLLCLGIRTVWQVLVMPLQGVLARKLIMAAMTLPRWRLVREDVLVPLQVAQSFAHLSAAGGIAREAHRAGAGDRDVWLLLLRGWRAVTAGQAPFRARG